MRQHILHRQGQDWCLFLDRDGVLNRKIEGGYVQRPADLELLSGVADAMRVLARWAPHIVVLTNQQGVGKRLMTKTDLNAVNAQMIEAVRAGGGRIDEVLSCTHLASEDCRCRKPKPGLAVSWLTAHPDVAAERSLMIGDAESDMQMAENLAQVTGGCIGIRITAQPNHHTALLEFPSLQALASAIEDLV